jgi:hypothetical protein
MSARQHRVVEPAAARVAVIEEGRLRQALGQRGLRRIERGHQLVQVQRADPQHRVAQRIAAVDVEAHRTPVVEPASTARRSMSSVTSKE